MVKEAAEHEAEDKERREEIERRNKLDNLCYTLEKTITENKDKLPGGDVSHARRPHQGGARGHREAGRRGRQGGDREAREGSAPHRRVMYQARAPGGPARPGRRRLRLLRRRRRWRRPEKGGDKKGGVIDAEFEETS